MINVCLPLGGVLLIVDCYCYCCHCDNIMDLLSFVATGTGGRRGRACPKGGAYIYLLLGGDTVMHNISAAIDEISFSGRCAGSAAKGK